MIICGYLRESESRDKWSEVNYQMKIKNKNTLFFFYLKKNVLFTIKFMLISLLHVTCAMRQCDM